VPEPTPFPRTRIACRRPSPSGRLQTSRLTGQIPEELLTEQVRRLAVFAAIGACVWTLALFLGTVVVPALGGTTNRPWRAASIELAGALSSGAMWLYFRWSKASALV
jgi:hypothetical protein